MYKTTRKCKCCGKLFTPEFGRQVFCTPACREQYHKRTKRLRKNSVTSVKQIDQIQSVLNDKALLSISEAADYMGVSRPTVYARIREGEIIPIRVSTRTLRIPIEQLKGKENVTKDGRSVKIYANIGGVDGIGAVLANDAGGIGLFRSEFLYLESEDYPTEEQQFTAYRKVLESMAGKKVIIRTLDIGADKQIDYFKLDKEDNPALGFRAVRICLTRPEIFRTQLRALYRASAFGELGIMFPMITSVGEVEECLAMCEQVKKELKDEDIPYSESVELGIMIETPAAAVISDRLAPMVDFFSVGTNDLTQYTLACDRQNAKLERFVDTHHEAVLRLIEMSAKNAHENGAWIGICGELAADTSLTETFLKMGIDELSVSAPFVLPLREKVRSLDLSE